MAVLAGSEKKKQVKWWEKTVEYKFIIDGINEKIFTSVAPLDSAEEAVGDTIIQIGLDDSLGKFFIIEFKKLLDSKAKSQEYRKYIEKSKGFKKTIACIKSSGKFKRYSNSHFFIYGDMNYGQFELKIKNYFEFYQDKNISLKKAFSNGMTASEFKNYTTYLTQHKKIGCNSNCNNGGNGGNSPPNSPKPVSPGGGGHSFVAAINASTGVLTFFPLVWVIENHKNGPEPSTDSSLRNGGGGHGLGKSLKDVMEREEQERKIKEATLNKEPVIC
ncbi:hypothetical protein [Morganella psychrotolerans]|uniref:Uncharacterized protein n=1 Tax=Morganella psychrotolerans TaxID=368603 RepID=A0A1B8HLS7_9GAMM|nr:hypothetical protein [Morganella psychrotolerans]OBU10294.1 hypothetical protein AYY18_18600 [Morganella psychrotolerans]